MFVFDRICSSTDEPLPSASCDRVYDELSVASWSDLDHGSVLHDALGRGDDSLRASLVSLGAGEQTAGGVRAKSRSAPVKCSRDPRHQED